MKPGDGIALSYFLDVVFPTQYPMYGSNIRQGGRGWLMRLLVHCEPFFYAALVTSSTFQYEELQAERAADVNELADVVIVQEKYLETSLELINDLAQNGCPQIQIGTVSALLQLFFFKVNMPIIDDARMVR